jgi:hypothetical protein
MVTLNDNTTSRRMVAAGNSEVWYEDIDMGAGEWIELTAAAGDIDTTDQLTMFEAFGKIFVVNGAKLRVIDFQNTKITTLNVGAHPPDRGNILTGGTSGAQMVVDYVTTLSGACTIYGYRTTAATFGAETVTGTDDDGNGISFTGTAEVAPPHWYNWTVYGGDTAHYGSMPGKAYLGALSGGRCVLSGNPSYPHQCPASAAGNPWDWNIYRTTADRAVPIGTGASGTIGDVVRALIPARDGQLVIGCAGSTHILVGNPADGGQMVDINGVGVYGANSWCFDADGNLYFWGTGGVYRLAKGSMQVENISQIVLPDLVDDADASPSTHRITMGHDVARAGIKICVTLLADGSSRNYWFDLKTGGFFPDSHANDHGVYAQFYYDANDPDYKGLLLGCKDGYVRVHDDAETNDDGLAIDSYVCFGPIPMAEDGRDGSIAGVDVTLAGGAPGGSGADSSSATLKIYADDVAETVVEQLEAGSTPKVAATFSGPGRRPGGRCRRGVRGAYAGVRIGNNTAGQTWGMEKIQIDGGATGRRKK